MGNTTTFVRVLRRPATLFLVSVSLWLTLFGTASAEIVRSFAADYEIHENGVVQVTEVIVYDFEQSQRHGIYRNIKDGHPQPATAWYKERYVDITLESVSRNGSPEPYVMEPYDGMSVRIGDPDQTISGEHRYKIVYTISGAIATYSAGTEFYWNVTGDAWEVPIQTVTATVTAGGAAALEKRQACYAGVAGNGASCSEIGVFDDRVRYTHSSLAPGEQLTIAQGVVLPGAPVQHERTQAVLLALVAGGVWMVVLSVLVYCWRTAYRTRRSVVAQYEPYGDFKPMFTGVLFDNRLDPRDISAGIVYLAEQGFLSITQTTDKVFLVFSVDDYKVTLRRPISEADTHAQKQLLQLLFDLDSEPGATIRLSDLRTDKGQQTANTRRIRALKKATVQDLIERGFLEQRLSRSIKMFVLPASVVVLFWLLPMVFSALSVATAIFMGIGVLTFIAVLLFALERRTKEGYAALNHLKGFKDFLATTETRRYAFHNAPAKSPQQFMEYLPYAIAFGVEKEWAEVFADVQIEQPEWYSGTNSHHFDARGFTTSLGAFASSFTSSSGSSGASGGGSSGGGAGGGGGGSW